MSQFSIATQSLRHSPHRADPCQACAVRDIAACSPLSPDERKRLTSIMHRIELGPNRLIFDEAEPADHVFTVAAGVVKIFKALPDGRCQVTGFLFPGDFLGLVNNKAHAYSAETLTVTELCRFRRHQLEALLAALPRLEQRLLGMASHEIAAAQDQMVLLGRKTARERVASFLVMLSNSADGAIALPMPRADMADYLGLTVETISRKLAQLRTQRVIQLPNDRRVRVLNFPALCRAAGRRDPNQVGA